MDNTLDQTTLDTISLLEARLLRIEHILYGPSAPAAEAPTESATTSLAELEHRFNQLLRHFRVYAEILKIYGSHPSLFQSPSPSSHTTTTTTTSSASQETAAAITTNNTPTQLDPAALRATVLSYASAFPATASALTAATHDTPIPDASQSAALAGLAPRMRAVEALQRAQAAEMSELRARGERVLRAWYEGGVLGGGKALADLEGRIERVERGVRRVGRGRVEGEKV